jgi:predicted MFS family arabinose efflux permease
MWGVSAAIGVTTGGRLSDRLGSKTVILSALAVLAAAFLTLSLSAYLLSPAAARTPVLVAIVLWGLAAWSYFPAQQARLIGVAGVQVASVVLSLNASFMFGGFALGALLGSVTITHASPAALGFGGAASVVGALTLAFAITRARKTEPATRCSTEASGFRTASSAAPRCSWQTSATGACG